MAELKQSIGMEPETAGQLGRGWHYPEQDPHGRYFRWTKGAATLFLRNGGGSMIELEAYRYPDSPRLTGKLIVNGTDVGPLDSEYFYGKAVRIPVPAGMGEILQFDLAMDKPWHTQDVPGTPGNRYLGLMMYRASNVLPAGELQTDLVMDGSDEGQIGCGWLPAEKHGRSHFRWTGDHALAVMPAEGTTLKIDASLPAGLMDRDVRLFSSGQLVGQGTIAGNGKVQRITAELSESDGWRTIRLEIDVPEADRNRDRIYGIQVHRMSVNQKKLGWRMGS